MKSLIQGKIEGKRRGKQRLRWLDININLMDMNLSDVQEIEDGGGHLAAVHDAAKSHTQLSKGTTTMNKQ